ncbi:MAG: quinone-interacting membrane-bound oxidoreductase complex subunit QmoC [Planctomycetota bacterium]
MATARVIEPDLDFVKAIQESGGDTVKKCMQCANCSVACELSPESRPFPRKEMIMAQWGLKEELLSDPDIWLCFGCTDCSVNCPRGARPGDVLGAIRKETIKKYAPFGMVQNLLAKPSTFPILLAIPIAIWAVIMFLVRGVEAETAGEAFRFAELFPLGVLEPVLGTMTLLGCAIFAVGAWRYWSALLREHPAPAGANFLASVVGAVKDVFSHARFQKCEAGKPRAIGHMLMFYGFTLIFVGGSAVGALVMFTDTEPPLPFFSPLKIMLNVGAIGLVAGSLLLLRYRLTRPERQMKATWFDWFFMVALVGAGVTGVLTEFLREGLGWRDGGFVMYFIHLVCVFLLLGYAPWSKIAHLVYRTVALVHAHYTGRLT